MQFYYEVAYSRLDAVGTKEFFVVVLCTREAQNSFILNMAFHKRFFSHTVFIVLSKFLVTHPHCIFYVNDCRISTSLLHYYQNKYAAH